MKVIIDRIEGNYAVVELKDGNVVDMSIKLLPKGAVEGSIIEITLKKEESKIKKEKIKKATEDMWE